MAKGADAPFDAVVPLVLDKQPGIRDGRSELVHTINGQAAAYVPALQVIEGQRVLVHVVNNTDEYHPRYVHGHVFDVLAAMASRCGTVQSSSTPCSSGHMKPGTPRARPITPGSE